MDRPTDQWSDGQTMGSIIIQSMRKRESLHLVKEKCNNPADIAAPVAVQPKCVCTFACASVHAHARAHMRVCVY